MHAKLKRKKKIRGTGNEVYINSKEKTGRCASCMLIKKRSGMAEIKDNEQLATNEAKEELRKLKKCWDKNT